jgi:hypothetical protein
MAIEPDYVYVVPPNYRMDIAEGRLSLSDMTRQE